MEPESSHKQVDLAGLVLLNTDLSLKEKLAMDGVKGAEKEVEIQTKKLDAMMAEPDDTAEWKADLNRVMSDLVRRKLTLRTMEDTIRDDYPRHISNLIRAIKTGTVTEHLGGYITQDLSEFHITKTKKSTHSSYTWHY